MFKPTYLYIKLHTITGKLYFGKTIRNPEEYLGSGTHWVNHIKKHGKGHVINLWYCLFYDEDECNQFALLFSEINNVVESTDWLNQVPESGLSGNTGVKFSEEHKQKIAEKSKLLIHSEDTKEKIRQLKTGLKHTDETKQKMSESRKGKCGGRLSDESIAKMKATKEAKKATIYHNPISNEERQIAIYEDVPEGFIKGRSPTSSRVGIPQTDNQKNKVKEANQKSFKICMVGGEVIEIKGLKDWLTLKNIPVSNYRYFKYTNQLLKIGIKSVEILQ